MTKNTKEPEFVITRIFDALRELVWILMTVSMSFWKKCKNRI